MASAVPVFVDASLYEPGKSGRTPNQRLDPAGETLAGQPSRWTHRNETKRHIIVVGQETEK